MAFLELSSDNEKFSWILSKNPETQRTANLPFIRNSPMYSNFLWFENDGKVSVFARYVNPKKTKDRYNNLDFTQHTKGEVYLQMIDNILRSALNKENELDTVPATLKFTVYNHNDIDYKDRIPEYVTECVTRHHNSEITIVAPSVKKCLEICTTICLITSFHDDDYYIDEDQYLKYLKFSVNTTKEYSLLRQFVSYIKSPKTYEKARPFIETTPFNITMTRAFDARRNFFRDEMGMKTRSKNLLEIGCGEGDYFKTDCKYYDSVIALEPDEDPHHDATHMIRKLRCEDKITLLNTDAMSHLNTLDTLENTDVLMTEVLEHIEIKESLKIIEKVLSLNPDKFLITLPNFDFNKYYGYKEGEFRHDDHHWEPTVFEFNDLNEYFVKLYQAKYDIKKYYLGDAVKAQPENCASFGVIFTKKV